MIKKPQHALSCQAPWVISCQSMSSSNAFHYTWWKTRLHSLAAAKSLIWSSNFSDHSSSLLVKITKEDFVGQFVICMKPFRWPLRLLHCQRSAVTICYLRSSPLDRDFTPVWEVVIFIGQVTRHTKIPDLDQKETAFCRCSYVRGFWQTRNNFIEKGFESCTSWVK